MNRTNLEHAGYALLMQLPFALAGFWWVGAAFGAGFFLGREHAQAQSAYNLGDFAAFDMRLWSLDSRLDIAFPVAAVLLASLIAEWL